MTDITPITISGSLTLDSEKLRERHGASEFLTAFPFLSADAAVELSSLEMAMSKARSSAAAVKDSVLSEKSERKKLRMLPSLKKASDAFDAALQAYEDRLAHYGIQLP